MPGIKKETFTCCCLFWPDTCPTWLYDPSKLPKKHFKFCPMNYKGEKGSWCLALISYRVVKSYEGLKMHTWDPNVQNYKLRAKTDQESVCSGYILKAFFPYILTSQESPPAGQESSTSLITQSRIFNLFNESDRTRQMGLPQYLRSLIYLLFSSIRAVSSVNIYKLSDSGTCCR